MHWTLSCGRNICESANFFLPLRHYETLDDLTYEAATDFSTTLIRMDKHALAHGHAIVEFIRQRMSSIRAIRNIMDLEAIPSDDD